MDTHSLIEQVSKDAKISKTKASKALEALERWISARLKDQEAVKIGSYGRFTTADKKLDARATRKVLPDPEIVFVPSEQPTGKVKSVAKRRKASTRSRVANAH